MKFDRASVLAGVRDGLPIAISAIPFGLIVGVTGVQSGLSVFQAASMPIIVYAGASQIAALQLFSQVAPLLVIWLTTSLINIRFVIYSASLAPHLAHLSVPWRLLLAYATTDQVFGLAVTRFRSEPRLKSPGAYFLLLTLLCWVAWTGAGVVGATMGVALPAEWHLDFVIPLIFMVMLVTSLRNGAAWVAAVTAGTVAVVAQGLPFNSGLIVGTLAGIVAGSLAGRAFGEAKE